MISRKGTLRSGAALGFAKILREEGSGPVVTAGRGVSGLERMFMGILLLISSSGFGAFAKPLSDPCIGGGVLGDIGTNGNGIGAGGETLRSLLELEAADRDQRNIADALLPLGDLRNALRREAHRFQRGRKDRPQRDIVGPGGKPDRQLVVVMGGD